MEAVSNIQLNMGEFYDLLQPKVILILPGKSRESDGIANRNTATGNTLFWKIELYNSVVYQIGIT